MMKKLLFILPALVLYVSSSAQLTLPQPSLKAVVTQTAGLTDITIDYSSPAVKGRTIWGGLLDYDQVWRAGANSSTKVTFSEDVMIDGKDVKKGTYSVFIIPRNGSDWSFILNSVATAGEGNRKDADDVVNVKVKPTAVPHRERLAYSVVDFDNDKATIQMEWEKVRVSLPVKLNTTKQAEANLNRLNNTWRDYNNAARYALEVGNHDKALGYVSTSIQLTDHWWNNWTKAQVLNAMGKNKEAYEAASKAKKMGDENPDGFFFKEDVEMALKNWKKM
ncbi:MAG: DUF2911 domain-containing protein [Saprospiraceae bacterium]|nr:DUF2911 domain-containing protein [Saprospiraceae bacterium]